MNRYYHSEEILPNVFRIGSEEGVFEYLFVGEKKALLFDTGYGYGDLVGTVRNITDLSLIVVNSHGHLDHACGNFQFKEDIYIHKEDMELCRVHNSNAMRKGSVESAKHTMDYVTHEIKNILPEGFDEDKYINQGFGNLIPVKDGHIFDLGELTLIVQELPGHTQGSIGLLYKEKNVLFAGDAINPFVWLFMPEATDLVVYRNTLERAKNMNLSYIAFSHSPILSPISILDNFIKCADTLDYENGFPFEGPMGKEFEPRICTLPGFGPMDIMKEGFAAIVISKPHL